MNLSTRLAIWNEAPSWAVYMAIDIDGEIYAFEHLPKLTKKKHWRCRVPDGKVKFMVKVYAPEGAYFGRCERIVWDRNGRINL